MTISDLSSEREYIENSACYVGSLMQPLYRKMPTALRMLPVSQRLYLVTLGQEAASSLWIRPHLFATVFVSGLLWHTPRSDRRIPIPQIGYTKARPARRYCLWSGFCLGG